MTTAPPSEARELTLLNKVELKIALSDDIQSSLKTYLPPILLKLASEHVAVRNKVKSCSAVAQIQRISRYCTGYRYLPTYQYSHKARVIYTAGMD